MASVRVRETRLIVVCDADVPRIRAFLTMKACRALTFSKYPSDIPGLDARIEC